MATVIKKIVEVMLYDYEYKFLKWLAKNYDNVNIRRELQIVFETELDRLKDNYWDEYMEDLMNGKNR